MTEDVEKQDTSHIEDHETDLKTPASSSKEPQNSKLKLDHHGLPLIPQPTDDPTDPLNWSYSKKLWVVCLMSICAFFGSFSLAVMNPAYAQVAAAIHVSVTEASYIGTTSILGAGVACFVWSPLSNVYGRRPILLFAQTLAVAAGFGSAFAAKYSGLVVGRFFTGLGHGATFVLTAVVMGDIFCLHERGKMIGIATVALINGPHVASLPGGYVATFISWRWTLILPSITAAVCWVLLVFGFPETLYMRHGERMPIYGTRGTFWSERRLWGFKSPDSRLKFGDFMKPIQMIRYPTIVAVALYGGVAFTLGSVMPAQTCSALFKQFYNWNSAHTGVALSVSTTIGGVLGELIAGPVTDTLITRSRLRSGGRDKVKPEARLHAMWPGVVLLPLGLVVFGVMIHFHTLKNSWVGPCIAMGVTCFAVQVITTPVIAYVVDCYKPQAAQTIHLLNFTRQTMAFTVGFWSLQFGEEVGFQWSGTTYALVSLLFFIPVGLVMKYGERIREKESSANVLDARE